MNALQNAKARIQHLADLLRRTSTARAAFKAQRPQPLPAPAATKLYIIGNMVQVRDAATERVLGWRESYLEAEQLGRDLVAGVQPALTRPHGAA